MNDGLQAARAKIVEQLTEKYCLRFVHPKYARMSLEEFAQELLDATIPALTQERNVALTAMRRHQESAIAAFDRASQAETEFAAVSARLAQTFMELEALKAENGTLHDTVRLAAIPITRHLTAKAEIQRLTTILANVEHLIERWREDVQAQAALHQDRLAEGSVVLWQHFTSTECAIEHCIGDLERALATPADPVTRRTP